MASLPFEILQTILKFLSRADLLPCLHVNNQWHEASVELLYTNITLGPRQPIDFMRTMVYSPRLSNYPKKIGARQHFSNPEYVHVSELHNDLIGVISAFCPKLQELHATGLSHDVWDRLVKIAESGQLAHLRSLSIDRVTDVISYISIILSLKNSLTTLILCDADDIATISRWSITEINRLIIDDINEFPNLQHLTIGHHTDQYFKDFDNLIERCRNLTSLSIRLYPITCRIRKENITSRSISSRRDISKLVCNWEMIKGDDQLRYIMDKLPELKSLKILYDTNLDNDFYRQPQPISYNIAKDFFNYMLAVPTLKFQLQLEKLTFTKIYTDFLKTNENFKSLTLSYIEGYIDSSKIIMEFKDNIPALGFGMSISDTALPHLEFLSTSGHLIKSITIECIWEIISMVTLLSDVYFTTSIQKWVQCILELCPLLEELMFIEPLIDASSYILSSRHTHLKLFMFSILNSSMSLDFLKSFSHHLPNLKQLHFGFGVYFSRNDPYHATVNMVSTKFDLITCSNISVKHELHYYIAIETDTRKVFFAANKNQLHPITEDSYKHSRKPVSIHIICFSLKELHIMWVGDEYDNGCITRIRTDSFL